MREISPAQNLSANEFMESCPWLRKMVEEIRCQKKSNSRPLPSAMLVDRSELLTPKHRRILLDAVAAFVDENLTGRSDMCLQFADLLQRALLHLKFPARAAVGMAMYFSPAGEEIHRWHHAWVRVGKEVIDGNVDSLFENPLVPTAVKAAPYWGLITETPQDRRLREDHSMSLPPDDDVSKVWWPDLRKWLDEEFVKT